MVLIMRIFKQRLEFSRRIAARGLALMFAALPGNVGAEQKAHQAARLTEEQRILHVLNRLGFGARPGDVERVKAIGIDNYIALQLSPEKIDDSVSEAKLQNLETLRMSTADL